MKSKVYILILLTFWHFVIYFLDAICNPSKYTDPKLVLTKYKLSWMINPAKTKTFIYIPDSFTGVGEERVFISDSGGHAEDYMISKISTPPIEFWITNTPCPCCARKLMAWYSNSILKAEIHATRFFADAPGRPQEKNAAIDCLAKMMAQGFTIVSWDWLEFHESFIRNAECSDVLKKAAENEKMFKKLSIQYEILGNALNEARKRSQTQNWLDNISNKCVQLQC